MRSAADSRIEAVDNVGDGCLECAPTRRCLELVNADQQRQRKPNCHRERLACAHLQLDHAAFAVDLDNAVELVARVAHETCGK